jgi:hypothetical protein
MATAIFDKELSGLRKDRWTKTFGSDPKEAGTDAAAASTSNRKATIVIEHIIEASDVAGSHDATLACLLEVEQAAVHGNVRRFSGWEIGQ